jgi:hypothetical protein
MLKGHTILFGVLVAISMVLWGCAGNLPQPERADIMDMHHGKSFESAKNEQILNPEAGKEPTPVEGFDGVAANDQMNKYRQALKRQEPIRQSVGVGKEVRGVGTGKR